MFEFLRFYAENAGLTGWRRHFLADLAVDSLVEASSDDDGVRFFDPSRVGANPWPVPGAVSACGGFASGYWRSRLRREESPS